MMDLHEIDRKLSGMGQEMKFYSYLTPLNREEEREKFFAAIRAGKEYDPVFCYREGGSRDTKEIWEEISSAIRQPGNGVLQLFSKKLDFMKRQLDLLESDDNSFGKVSARLYGTPDAECLKLSEDILARSKKEGYNFPEETVSPGEMAAILRSEIEKKKIAWKVVLSGKIVPKITVSGVDRTLYINSTVNYTAEEVERLKIHEVKVHVYRGANGDTQSFRIFAEGLAGYNETEEGLAIALEHITGCLDVDRRQLKLYAARAVCADRCVKGSFSEVFSRMREFFPDYLAYRLTERGKRGMRDTSRKGGITNGFHYISGWIKTRKYIEDGGDLSILYVGKVGLDDVGIIKSLLDEGVLRPPEYLPEIIRRGLGNKNDAK